MKGLPEGWNSVSLANLLTEDQLKSVIDIQHRAKSFDQLTKELKEYFGQHREYLQERGLDADFLAYAVAHAINVHCGDQVKRYQASLN